MALVVPNVGEAKIFENFLNVTAPQTLTLKLYTNSHTPAESDTASNYTEASGFGYSAVTLTPGSWTITQGNPTTASFPQQTFTFTGNLGNVYGYYVVQSTSGILMWAEQFSDGPYNIVNNGDQIKITLQITLE
jgi:hypothetical protein